MTDVDVPVLQERALVDHSVARDLTPLLAGAARTHDYAWRGESLAVLTSDANGRCSLALIDLRGGAVRYRVPVASIDAFRVGAISDDDRLAFTDGPVLTVLDRDGAVVCSVELDLLDTPDQVVVWTGDDALAVVRRSAVYGGCAVARVRLSEATSGEPTDLEFVPDTSPYQRSPDGSLMLFQGAARRSIASDPRVGRDRCVIVSLEDGSLREVAGRWRELDRPSPRHSHWMPFAWSFWDDHSLLVMLVSAGSEAVVCARCELDGRVDAVSPVREPPAWLLKDPGFAWSRTRRYVSVVAIDTLALFEASAFFSQR